MIQFIHWSTSYEATFSELAGIRWELQEALDILDCLITEVVVCYGTDDPTRKVRMHKVWKMATNLRERILFCFQRPKQLHEGPT